MWGLLLWLTQAARFISTPCIIARQVKNLLRIDEFWWLPSCGRGVMNTYVVIPGANFTPSAVGLAQGAELSPGNIQVAQVYLSREIGMSSLSPMLGGRLQKFSAQLPVEDLSAVIVECHRNLLSDRQGV
jgi:hypothetical protein